MAKIFISFNIVSTSDFLMVVRESDDPLAEVYRSTVLTPPHTIRNVTVDNLNPVMHRVEFWTTSDGTTLDELRGVCDIDASISNEVAFGYIQFVVDRGNGAPEYDPVSGDTQYVNPDLDGKDYLVFKEGYGALKWGINIQTISGGGFEFIDGSQFGNEEGYTVQYSNISSTSSTTSGKPYPSDVLELTSDTAFGSTHYNKLLEVNAAGAGSILTITISSLDAIPNGTIFGINTHNGNQRYVTLQLNSGRYCLINNTINGPQQRNSIYVGRGEEVTFIKKGSYLRIVHWDGDYRRLGHRIFADGLQPVNTLPETGGWYLKTDYPRLFNWYIAELPGSELGTGTQDATPDIDNLTKWIIGSTKFWVPDTSGLSIRATSSNGTIDLGGPRLAGSYQADENKAHNHITLPYNRASAKADEAGGDFTPNAVDSGSASQEYRIGGMNSARWEDARIKDQGTESRPKNVATNFYRII
jgi:hypothetical protein